MASRSERYFGIYEIKARPLSHPDAFGCINIAALEIIQRKVAEARDSKNPIEKTIISGRIFVTLDDFKLDKDRDIVVMLFTVSDGDAADAVYRKRSSASSRSFTKDSDEGGAVSVHLVMQLKPRPDTMRYLTAFEDMEGAPRSRIIPFLEEIFRKICGPISAVNSKGVVVNGPVRFEVDSLQRDNPAEFTGRPMSAEIVQLTPRATLDAGGEGYTEKKRAIYYRIDGKQSAASALKSMMSIRIRQKEKLQEYPIMRVRWKRADGKEQTLKVESLNEDLMQRAFAWMEPVSGIEPPLPMSFLDIRWDVIDKVRDVLQRHIGNRPDNV